MLVCPYVGMHIFLPTFQERSLASLARYLIKTFKTINAKSNSTLCYDGAAKSLILWPLHVITSSPCFWKILDPRLGSYSYM